MFSIAVLSLFLCFSLSLSPTLPPFLPPFPALSGFVPLTSFFSQLGHHLSSMLSIFSPSFLPSLYYFIVHYCTVRLLFSCAGMSTSSIINYLAYTQVMYIVSWKNTCAVTAVGLSSHLLCCCCYVRNICSIISEASDRKCTWSSHRLKKRFSSLVWLKTEKSLPGLADTSSFRSRFRGRELICAISRRSLPLGRRGPAPFVSREAVCWGLGAGVAFL